MRYRYFCSSGWPQGCREPSKKPTLHSRVLRHFTSGFIKLPSKKMYSRLGSLVGGNGQHYGPRRGEQLVTKNPALDKQFESGRAHS